MTRGVKWYIYPPPQETAIRAQNKNFYVRTWNFHRLKNSTAGLMKMPLLFTPNSIFDDFGHFGKLIQRAIQPNQ
jgi:hypothetical protein